MASPIPRSGQGFNSQGDAESPRLLPRQAGSLSASVAGPHLQGSGQLFSRRAEALQARASSSASGASQPSATSSSSLPLPSTALVTSRVLPPSVSASNTPQPSAQLLARTPDFMKKVVQQDLRNRRLRALVILTTVCVVGLLAIGMANRRESNPATQSTLSSLQNRVQWYVDHPYTSIPAAFVIYRIAQAVASLIK